jgi:hypothetical protein
MPTCLFSEKSDGADIITCCHAGEGRLLLVLLLSLPHFIRVRAGDSGEGGLPAAAGGATLTHGMGWDGEPCVCPIAPAPAPLEAGPCGWCGSAPMWWCCASSAAAAHVGGGDRALDSADGWPLPTSSKGMGRFPM